MVNLGRWAGFFVLGSAVVLTGLEAWGLYGDVFDLSLRYIVMIFWRNAVSTGSLGVIIILLAELLDRLSEVDYGYDESGASDEAGEDRP